MNLMSKQSPVWMAVAKSLQPILLQYAPTLFFGRQREIDPYDWFDLPPAELIGRARIQNNELVELELNWNTPQSILRLMSPILCSKAVWCEEVRADSQWLLYT